MNRIATRFTELSSATYAGLLGARMGTDLNATFNGREFGSSGFATPYYEQRPGNNQVRHAAAAMIQGYVRGEAAALAAMNSRENPRDRIHGVPDINLNGAAVPMGARLAGGMNGMALAPKLGQWIRDNLCER